MANFYGGVATPTNTFSNNKKVKMVAANVADQRIFTKSSVSKMKQSDFEGKKYGKSFTLYIPGRPKVVNGVTVDPTPVDEIETSVFLDNDNVSEVLGPWERMGDVESFRDQFAIPFAETLGRSQEKKIVEHEIFKAMTAVIAPKTTNPLDGADFGVLGRATAKLRKLALSPALVGFLDPEVQAEIADKAVSDKFITNDKKFMDLYGENAIGKYATAGWVESPDLPTIHTSATAATGAISLTAITDASTNTIGFETVTQISGTNLHKGAVFNVDGLKVVDTSGIQTTVPVQIVVVDVNSAGTVGYISPLRITIDGKACHNPNAWVAAGTSSLTLTYALKADTDYVIAEVRTKECFCYDTYQFDVLPGEKDEVVAGVGGSNLKLRMYGDGTNLNKMFRIDSTYAASLFEPREACLILIEK